VSRRVHPAPAPIRRYPGDLCTVRQWTNRRGLTGTIVSHRLRTLRSRVHRHGTLRRAERPPPGFRWGRPTRRGTRPATQASAAYSARRPEPPFLHGCPRIRHPFLPRVVPCWMRSLRAMRIVMLTQTGRGRQKYLQSTKKTFCPEKKRSVLKKMSLKKTRFVSIDTNHGLGTTARGPSPPKHDGRAGVRRHDHTSPSCPLDLVARWHHTDHREHCP
jgi:hypothetical protein